MLQLFAIYSAGSAVVVLEALLVGVSIPDYDRCAAVCDRHRGMDRLVQHNVLAVYLGGRWRRPAT